MYDYIYYILQEDTSDQSTGCVILRGISDLQKLCSQIYNAIHIKKTLVLKMLDWKCEDC